MLTLHHILQYIQMGCMSEFARYLSPLKNNTAEVLCTIHILIKGSCSLTFKLCFCLLAETCISLEIFSIFTHDCLNCFHDFFEIKFPFPNNGITCHFIMVAGIYNMLFSSLSCIPEITMIIKAIMLNSDVITGLESERMQQRKSSLCGPKFCFD